jgi:hypothetical protein
MTCLIVTLPEAVLLLLSPLHTHSLMTTLSGGKVKMTCQQETEGSSCF